MSKVFTRYKHETYQVAKELGYYKIMADLRQRIYSAETESEVTRIMITCRHEMMRRDGDVI